MKNGDLIRYCRCRRYRRADDVRRLQTAKSRNNQPVCYRKVGLEGFLRDSRDRENGEDSACRTTTKRQTGRKHAPGNDSE